MPSHGTALQVTPSIVRDFHSAVIAQLPDLTDEEMQQYNRNKNDLGVKLRVLVSDTATPASPAPTPAASPVIRIPDVGEVFELTLNGDSTDPIGMLKSDGINPKGWKHDGPKVTGPQTRRFKLVQVGYQKNLDAVREALASHGNIPEGQWREAFKAVYPTPDGKGPIGIADPSWVDQDGRRFFPYVGVDGECWRSNFGWAVSGRDGYWRWLVACE